MPSSPGLSRRVLLSWSSGKDSAWALHVLRQQPDIEVVGLLTTFNKAADRVAMHAVRRALVDEQASAAGLDLWPVFLPWPCSNAEYEELMTAALARARAERVTHVAFGDLFLDDVRDYRIRQMAGTGIAPLFPLWGSAEETPALANRMLDAGVRAVLTCVDPRQLPESFVGRQYDRALLADLPPSVDPCGERGEFHSFCYAGPMFRSEIAVRVGEVVTRDGFCFADVSSAGRTPRSSTGPARSGSDQVARPPGLRARVPTRQRRARPLGLRVAGAARIAEARALIGQYLEPTPLVKSATWSTPERSVFLKNETVQPTGSFKVRGAIYALSSNLARGTVREVVAASTGNHGAAVAYAARLLGVPARICLPRDSNPVKVARIRDLGAVLVENGIDLSAATDTATAYASETSAFFLHDASDPDVPLGPATMGAEILEQLPAPDVVYVPIGDTALIRGIATALSMSTRPIRVVGVCAAGAPAYCLSWKSGAVVETESARTIADGLAVRRPIAPNVSSIRRLVDEVVTVSEGEMIDAIARLHASEGILAEPSGAAALAALLRDAPTGTCVALVTGGNISPDVERLALRQSIS